MAIVLDATVSGSSSNSYVTLTRGQELLEQLPHANEWATDFTINRAQLFIHATRLIDRLFRFYGSKTVESQSLQWPRLHVIDPLTGAAIPSNGIPEFVEWATIEWAILLQDDADSDTRLAPGITRLRTPSYEAEFGGNTRERISKIVSDLLMPYGDKAIPNMIRLMRA